MHGGHSGKQLSSSHALGRISSACVQSGSGQLASHAVIETGKADQKNATECACVHPRIAASQPANPLQPATQSVATTQPAMPVGRCRRQIMYGCNARHIRIWSFQQRLSLLLVQGCVAVRLQHTTIPISFGRHNHITNRRRAVWLYCHMLMHPALQSGHPAGTHGCAAQLLLVARTSIAH